MNHPAKYRRKKPVLSDYQLAEFLPVFHDSSTTIMVEQRLQKFFEKKKIIGNELRKKYKRTANAANSRNFPCHKGGLNVIQGSSISPGKLPLFLFGILKKQKTTR